MSVLLARLDAMIAEHAELLAFLVLLAVVGFLWRIFDGGRP